MTAEMSNVLPLILIAAVLLVIGVWVLMRANRRARVIDEGDSLKRDVLDEGAARAARNQALIDAAPATVKAAPTPVPAPVAPPSTSPPPPPSPSPAPTPASGGDDITRIKGLGPKIAGLLGDMGITTFAQIAAWSEDDITRIDSQLGRFSGRIRRDQWVAQARLLAAGDETGFAEKFGNNG